MAHTLLYTLGYNAPEDRLLPEDFDWTGPGLARWRYRKMTDALRPWTIDFHVAQNDGTVKGSGSHDKTGRHCLPTDPNGKLDIVQRRRLLAARRGRQAHASAFQHICWDGCMFPNEVMMKPADLERHPRRDDRGPRRARLGWKLRRWRKKTLNIGMVGYGFMGRTHSNAFAQVAAFLRPAATSRC